MQCVLCGGEIKPKITGWTLGNNAEPLAKGRCCDTCNFDVIAHRFRCMRLSEKILNTTWEYPNADK